MKGISYALTCLSGLTVGSAFGGAILALGILTRAFAIFKCRRIQYAWAVSAGAAGISLAQLSGSYLPLGNWAGLLLIMSGGVFVGMMAAALAELMELLPVVIVRSRLSGLLLPALLAVALGKALGEIMAASAGI